jgi:hypothetical protein
MERSSSATRVPGTLGPEPREQHSTGELIKMMTEQMSVLVRDEMKLAQLEMTRKGKQAALGAGMFGASGLQRATPPVPKEAVASTKADVEEIKERAHR